jgi:hypothetical protein
MIKKDIYGKTLSTSFSSAISGYSQFVKPKITINLLDSRHVENLQISSTDDHVDKTKGSIGYYFPHTQLMNGYEQESFLWAVCDAKEKDGTVIKADGRYFTAPSNLENDYEFGWWSKTKSQANGSFASPPIVTMTFDERKVNKVRVTTSESLGQIKEFRLRVQSSDFIDLLDQTYTFKSDQYYKDFYLRSVNASNAQYNVAKIILTVFSTKNGEDYARVHEVAPIYELDITDDVIDYSVSRSRDVHESSLPIGGTQSPKITIKLDNTDKNWNLLDPNNGYGKYMNKDLKIEVATGWRIKKTDDILSETLLRSNISNSSSEISVLDTAIFPTAGSFIAVISPDSEDREVVVCSQVIDTNTVGILERGYYNSEPVAHSAGSVVQFDPYEYVPMGTYYVDEWTSSTSDMTVTIQASDFSKFLSEKNLTDGFLVESKTAGEAVFNLLMRANFPRSRFRQVVPYSKDVVNYGGVARYSFSEDSIDKSGAAVSLENGLRLRLWGMRSGKESEYRIIKADVLEKNLSIEDRIQGLKAYSTPDKTVLTTEHPGSLSTALNYSNFTFTSILTSQTFTKYFNGVVDGYYIPLLDGNQDLMIRIANAGVRVYLDDVLIVKSETDATSSVDLSAYSFRNNNFLNLTAGIPYRLRIEFWRGFGDQLVPSTNFSIGLYKSNTSLSYSLVSGAEVRTTVARDGIGSRNSNETPVSYDKYNTNLSHHQNDGFISANVQLSYAGSFTTEENNRGILLIDDGYVRIPRHSSISIGESDFSIELIAKFYNGYFSSGDGEYLSTWNSNSPSDGYEFFYNDDASHGFKIKTSSNVSFVNGTTELQNGDFYHIVATYKTSEKKLKYYVNSVLEGQTTITGNIIPQTHDITIGGRGASFTAGVGESGITTGRDFIFDEFAIYRKCLTEDDVLKRFISTQSETATTFPFLYSGIGHIREAIDAITLGDLGRFYIDEENYARYESYNRFFEPSIDQHANVQYSLSDSSDIISSDVATQLQTNKVIVKVSSVANTLSGTQPLWSAPDPTTLATVKLTGDIEPEDTFIPVSATTDPVFANTGYLAMSKTVDSEVKTEILKYLSKTETSFLQVQRGMFDTTPLSFVADTKVREARYYEVNYDKSPAIAVNQPFIIGINDEDPDIINVLKFENNSYTAKLVIAAAVTNDFGSIVYAQGKNPITEKDYFTSISGIPVLVTESSEQVTEQVESLGENIRKYGLKELTIDSPYITSLEHAGRIAKFIIEKMKDPVPIVNIEIMSIPTLQLGDRIQITSLDAFGIINGEYWVISQEFSYGASVNHSLILRKVV